jgi:hypothetical protein
MATIVIMFWYALVNNDNNNFDMAFNSVMFDKAVNTSIIKIERVFGRAVLHDNIYALNRLKEKYGIRMYECVFAKFNISIDSHRYKTIEWAIDNRINILYADEYYVKNNNKLFNYLKSTNKEFDSKCIM